MSWVKLDDGYDEHPKVQLAGEDASYMFVRGLLYCNRQKTLGFIPEGKVASLTTKPHWKKLANTLVTCGESLGEQGMWEKVAGGYLVVNYAKYQLTNDEDKKQANARTERLRELGRRGGQATQMRAPHVARNLKRSKQATEAGTEAALEAAPEATSEAEAEAARFGPARSGTGSGARSPDPVPVLRSRAGEHAHADATPARTSGLEAVVDDATTRHDGGARVGGGAGARAWTAADLDELWRSTYRRPTGDSMQLAQLAGRLREAAELRGESAVDLAPRFLGEFRAMLGDWKARKQHHGAPQVSDALRHFDKVLERLDDGGGGAEPEQPDNPAYRRIPRAVRPQRPLGVA